MRFEHLEYRLDIVKNAAERTRVALITATITASVTVIAAWNAYLSAYRGFPMLKDFAKSEPTRRAQSELIRQWVESQWITFEPLGIRIGIGDAAVVAGLGLYLIAIWLFYASRREHRAVAHLLSDVEHVDDDDIHRLVHHAITSAMLFISVRDDDEPITDISHLDREETKPMLRSSVKALFYLPAVAITVALVLDCSSLYIFPAPYRASHEPLFSGGDISASETWQFLGMMFGETIIAAVSWLICARIVAFSDATTDLIRNHLHRHHAKVKHGKPAPATPPRRKSRRRR
jgi:hypothetical protein